jgi:hypothetical protein
MPAEGGVVEIPGDVLPLDDRRWFAAGRAGSQRIVLREDAPVSALRLALEAGAPASGIEVDAVPAGRMAGTLADADAIVINDVERLVPSDLQALLDFHRAGGAVMIVLGANADAAFWNASVLREIGAGVAGEPAQTAPGAAWRLLRRAAGHPVLSGFPARPGEPLSTARFERVRAFEPAEGTRVLLEFDAGHPALVEGRDLLVFCASLEPDASDFPVSGAFLPLMHQAVKVLARGTAAPSLVPGEQYAAPATTGQWRIEGPDGAEVASELTAAAGATRLVSAPLERPGLYRVLRGPELRSTFAVNPDPAEADLTALGEGDLVRMFPDGRARIMRPGDDLAQRVREARFGRELWSLFVILALLLLVAESVIARLGMGGRAAVRQAE